MAPAPKASSSSSSDADEEELVVRGDVERRELIQRRACATGPQGKIYDGGLAGCTWKLAGGAAPLDDYVMDTEVNVTKKPKS
jgi:hypothetical protein